MPGCIIPYVTAINERAGKSMPTKKRRFLSIMFIAVLICMALALPAIGQRRSGNVEDEDPVGGQGPRGGVKTVTIPITIRERGKRTEQELMPVGDLIVREDGDVQRILSVRSIS